MSRDDDRPAGPAAPLQIEAQRVIGPKARRSIALVVVALLGLGAGISPLFSAYYDEGIWIPIGIGLVVVATAAMVARPPEFAAAQTAVVGALIGLGLLSLLSGLWANGVEQTIVAGNRWLVYAALFVIVIALTRGARAAAVLLVAVGVGVVIVGADVLLRMLGSDPATLFLGGRLNAPLGYVNGEGCVFAMACWLGLALAERRKPPQAGIGAGLSVAFGSLALLSQSRGAVIATAVAVLVALLAIPGFRRRVLALVAIAGGMALASSAVLKVYSAGGGSALPPASVVHAAALAVLGASAAAGVVWGVIVAIACRIERRGADSARLLRRAATTVAVAAIALPVLGALVRVSSIERSLKTQWSAFVNLAPPASGTDTTTHLLTGAGNRYDYWRVAWHVFLDHPLAGVGAGNYPQYYFLERRTTEAIQNPHSLELQTLSELGLLGAIALLLLMAGVVAGAVRLRRSTRRTPAARTLMVAAVGTFTVWLVDSSGDWMPLLPGVTAIALAAVAVLTGGGEPEMWGSIRMFSVRSARTRLRPIVGSAALLLVLVIAGASLVRSDITHVDVVDAHAELATHPLQAISDARAALRFDSANLDAYYLEAAGLARLDRAAASRAILLAATREDPGEYVTWILLGDLEVRLGNLHAARGYYRTAYALDPNDPSVAQLVSDPAAALAPASG